MGEKGAMVTSWGAARVGAPAGKGMEVFGNALAWYDELAKEGRITGYRVYGSINREYGMIVAEGACAELAKISTEEKSTTMLALASGVVDDVRTELFIGGSPDDVVGYYTRSVDALTQAGLIP